MMYNYCTVAQNLYQKKNSKLYEIKIKLLKQINLFITISKLILKKNEHALVKLYNKGLKHHFHHNSGEHKYITFIRAPLQNWSFFFLHVKWLFNSIIKLSELVFKQNKFGIFIIHTFGRMCFTTCLYINFIVIEKN